MADFEFFKKQFEFVGKHARMVSELCVSNDYEHTYFKRYIDVYIFAAIIGIRIDRKASRDYSPVETKSILPEQMINAKEDLDFIMQMMVLPVRRTRTGCARHSGGLRQRKSMTDLWEPSTTM